MARIYNFSLSIIKTSKHPRVIQRYGSALNFLSHNYENIQTSKDLIEVWLEFQISVRQISKHPIMQWFERGLDGFKNMSDNYQNIQTSRDFRDVWLEYRISACQLSKHPNIQGLSKGMAQL